MSAARGKGQVSVCPGSPEGCQAGAVLGLALLAPAVPAGQGAPGGCSALFTPHLPMDRQDQGQEK